MHVELKDCMLYHVYSFFSIIFSNKKKFNDKLKFILYIYIKYFKFYQYIIGLISMIIDLLIFFFP